ncbi:lipopolysaccharide-binding protein LBP [Acrasis kona]|uniref:Lipopolysaccharide-binding protein LBP n=1 Tax=Acrasis kona TaxID=1008807 RepID=A0AAW2ZHV4_9EUKA
MNAKVFIVTLLCVVLTVLSQESGARFIFSDEGMNAVIKKYIPDYAAVILSTQIPSIHVTQKVPLLNNVDFNIEDLKLNKIDFGDFRAHCEAPNVVILGTTTALVEFSLKWSYRQTKWPHISGHGTASGFADKTKLMGHVVASVVDGRFHFKSQSIVLDIGNSKVSIKGGFSGWIANLVEGLFRKTLRHTVEKEVQKVISEKLDVTLNDIIKKTNFVPELRVGKEPQTLNWVEDFTIPDNQLFMNEKFLSVAPRLISRPVRQQQPSTLKPVSLPDQPTSADRNVNAFITDFMFNSFFEALHLGGQLHYAVLPEAVPDYSPIKFNTSAFKMWFPTMYEKYPNKAIRLDVETLSAPVVTFSPEGIKLSANASILFSTKAEDGNFHKTFVTSALVGASYSNVSATSSKAGTLLTLGGKVEALVQLNLIESFIGEVNCTKFGQIINMVVLRGALGQLNKKLAAGFEIDLNTLLPGLYIDDLQLFLKEHYVNVNTNATYVPKEIVIPKTNDNETLKMLSFMMMEMEKMKGTITQLENELGQCKAK